MTKILKDKKIKERGQWFFVREYSWMGFRMDKFVLEACPRANMGQTERLDNGLEKGNCSSSPFANMCLMLKRDHGFV